MSTPIIFLTDNGSLRPEATFALRQLASALSARVSARVEPVSLLHSHKIDAELLGGVPATIVKRRMRELIAEGQRKFIVLPLFLGPSLAITDYLPQVVEDLKKECVDLEVNIAKPLAGDSVESPDSRLAEMLADFLRAMQIESGARIALVDHGTPIRPVNRLRDAVAAQLEEIMGVRIQPCSMERRDGPEYDFNDPLLESLGDVSGFSGGPLILAMFFLLPGRHAGAAGDVAEIADGLIQENVFSSVSMLPLLAEHVGLLEILEDRLMPVLSGHEKARS